MWKPDSRAFVSGKGRPPPVEDKCMQSIRLDHVPVVAERTKLFQQERAKFQPCAGQMRAAQISRAESLNGKRPNWKSKVDQVKGYVPMYRRSDTSTHNASQASQTVASKRKLSG